MNYQLKIVLAVATVVIFIFWIASANTPDKRALASLFALLSTNPEEAAATALKGGDHRYYGIMEFSGVIPGVDKLTMNESIEKQNVKYMPYLDIPQLKSPLYQLREDAARYASRYNAVINDAAKAHAIPPPEKIQVK